MSEKSTLSVTVSLPPDAVEIFERICKRYRWSKNTAFIEILRWLDRVQRFAGRMQMLEDEQQGLLLLLDEGMPESRWFHYFTTTRAGVFQDENGDDLELEYVTGDDDFELACAIRDLLKSIQEAPLGLDDKAGL
jgi:hypothetical protein